MVRRIVVVTCLLCSAVLSSQAPEFAQQYRQRLGGAIDELHSIVTNFDQDANEQGLSRQQALEQLASAQQAFFQSRASRMQAVFTRYIGLTRQQQHFNSLNPALRPIALLSIFDKTILQGTWEEYQPALALTLYGALWTVIGGLFGWLLAVILLILPFSAKKSKQRRRRRLTAPKF